MAAFYLYIYVFASNLKEMVFFACLKVGTMYFNTLRNGCACGVIFNSEDVVLSLLNSLYANCHFRFTLSAISSFL